MSLHSNYVSKIKDQAIRLKASSTTSIEQQEEERLLLCNALIKCADISNVARPFHWGTQWAELLVKEFIFQGDLEKELGLPVSPMNDRSKINLEDSQISFIQFVALDLFQNVQKVIHEIEFAVDQMQFNLKQWQARKQQKDALFGSSNISDATTCKTSTTIVSEKSKEEQDDEHDFDIISNSSTTQMMMIETGILDPLEPLLHISTY